MSALFGILLLLFLADFNTCQLKPSATPYLILNGSLSNHSYLNFAQLERGSRAAISCFSERTTCCTASNRASLWVNPHGVEINNDVIDGLTVEYGVMVIKLWQSYFEDVKPVSGIYTCDAMFEGADSGRNQIYVGLYYATGGDVEISDIVKLAVDSDLNGASPQFTITCVSSGGPATTVTWTRDSQLVKGETRSVLNDAVAGRYTHNLTVTGRHPGNYKCSVSNNKPSSDSAKFTVKVGTAPNVTRICQTSSTSVLIDWTPPNPLGDTTGYRVNYYTNEDGSNQPVINTAPGLQSTSYILSGLNSGVYYFVSVEGVSEHFYSGQQQAVFHLLHFGEEPSCDGENIGGGKGGGGGGGEGGECGGEGSSIGEGGSEEGGEREESGHEEEGGSGKGREGEESNMVVLAGLIGAIIGGLTGCLATGALVVCVYYTRGRKTLTQESRHSAVSSSRPESEYVPPPSCRPDVTRPTQQLNSANKRGSDVLTMNAAYNFSPSRTSLRDWDETVNGAYGVAPLNLNLARNLLHPEPPTNPPPIYYDRVNTQ